VDIAVDGDPTPATVLSSSDDTWLLTMTTGEFHLSVNGAGPTGSIGLHRLTDINPAIDARKAYLASRPLRRR